MRTLVTGGSGFIGSHVVDALVERGHEVVVLDRAQPKAPNPAATYLSGDCRNHEVVAGALSGIDAVSHQAARVGMCPSFEDLTRYVDDNDVGTAVLLSAMHDAGFSGRLVLASSMVVYGEGGYRCARCGPVRPVPRSVERLRSGLFEPPCPACGSDLTPAAVTEQAPLDPRNVYAATKVHQEHLCSLYGREHGATMVALRYHNVYGPRLPSDTPYAGVASLFRNALLGGCRPKVFEDGGQLRDFVHVRDVARANASALERDSVPSGAYNIASGHPVTVLYLAEQLCAVLGSNETTPSVSGDWRLGDVRHVFASAEKARSQLGFEPRVLFSDGIQELAMEPDVGSEPIAAYQ